MDLTTNTPIAIATEEPDADHPQTVPGFNNITASTVLPINDFANSLFRSVTVQLNGQSISVVDNSYPFRSFLETLLNFPNEAKKTHLRTGIYYPDTAGSLNDGNSRGYRERARYINGGTLEMITFVHHELAGVDRLLPSNLAITFNFEFLIY